MLTVSNLNFKTGGCVFEDRLSETEENYSCLKNHLTSILNSLFQVVEATEFCSIESRL
jgi:hypothetical protein